MCWSNVLQLYNWKRTNNIKAILTTMNIPPHSFMSHLYYFVIFIKITTKHAGAELCRAQEKLGQPTNWCCLPLADKLRSSFIFQKLGLSFFTLKLRSSSFTLKIDVVWNLRSPSNLQKKFGCLLFSQKIEVVFPFQKIEVIFHFS